MFLHSLLNNVLCLDVQKNWIEDDMMFLSILTTSKMMPFNFTHIQKFDSEMWSIIGKRTLVLSRKLWRT